MRPTLASLHNEIRALRALTLHRRSSSRYIPEGLYYLGNGSWATAYGFTEPGLDGYILKIGSAGEDYGPLFASWAYAQSLKAGFDGTHPLMEGVPLTTDFKADGEFWACIQERVRIASSGDSFDYPSISPEAQRAADRFARCMGLSSLGWRDDHSGNYGTTLDGRGVNVDPLGSYCDEVSVPGIPRFHRGSLTAIPVQPKRPAYWQMGRRF